MFARHGKKSIQSILFYRFLSVTAVLLIVISAIVYLIQYTKMYKNMENDIIRTSSSIGNAIDLQVSQMDNVCLNVINSTSVKDTFADWISNKNASAYERRQQQNQLSNSLISIRGIDTSIRQVNLYSMEAEGYGVGNYYGKLSSDTSDLSWYEGAIKKDGYRFFQADRHPLRSRHSGTEADRLYFSLYRMYFDNYHNPAGFVEVSKYYDKLFAEAISPTTAFSLDITVYDDDGRQIYPDPASGGEKRFDYYTELPSQKLSSGSARVYNHIKHQQEFVTICPLKYSGFTVAAAINNTNFYSPILVSLMWIPLLALSLFVVCYFVAGFLSRRLAQPLTEMHQFLSQSDSAGKFRQIDLKDSGVIEIDRLRDSLNSSIRTQEAATESLLVMKESEIQAHMLALQAQMNPHFLYNSLNTIGAMAEEGMTEEVTSMCQDITSILRYAHMLALQAQMNPHFLYNSLNTIGAMAEEGMTEEVTSMCQDITSILRYISSDKESVSTVEEELEHCSLYLNCMKMRFKDKFTYEFDIDDNLLEMKIPKLCIQLLIENSVKFVSKTAPPWYIRIEGYIDAGQWLISVKDNGPGFDPEVDRHLRSQMDEILKYSRLPSLELDGMGILNIFIRFYLLFGHSFLFQFGNLPEGGAFVIVGGRFHEKD